MSNNIQATAMENALTDERKAMQIQFPITGDKELDFLSAVLVLSSALELEPCHAERACEYLKHRFHSLVIDYSKIFQQQAALGVSAQPQYPYPPWATSSGTGALAGAISAKNNLGGFDMLAQYDPAIMEDRPKYKSFSDLLDAIKAGWKKDTLHHGP